MVKLPYSKLRTSWFSFTEGSNLDRHAVGRLMMCLTKIATHGLATILITYISFIDS